MENPPNQTIYINNLNEKIKKEGKFRVIRHILFLLKYPDVMYLSPKRPYVIMCRYGPKSVDGKVWLKMSNCDERGKVEILSGLRFNNSF